MKKKRHCEFVKFTECNNLQNNILIKIYNICERAYKKRNMYTTTLSHIYPESSRNKYINNRWTNEKYKYLESYDIILFGYTKESLDIYN